MIVFYKNCTTRHGPDFSYDYLTILYRWYILVLQSASWCFCERLGEWCSQSSGNIASSRSPILGIRTHQVQWATSNIFSRLRLQKIRYRCRCRCSMLMAQAISQVQGRPPWESARLLQVHQVQWATSSICVFSIVTKMQTWGFSQSCPMPLVI